FRRMGPATMLRVESSNPSHNSKVSSERIGGTFLRGAAGLATVLLAWQLLAFIGAINAVLLPSPFILFWTTIDLLRDGTLLRHVGASIERVLIGVLCASVTGLALGV